MKGSKVKTKKDIIISDCIIALGVIAIAILVNFIMIKVCNINKINANIVDIDGIAYISVEDEVSRLLDVNGKQIVFNDFIKSEHSLVAKLVVIDKDKNMYVVYDEDTDMYYIGIKDITPQDMVRTINIMYDKELVKQ